MTKRRKGAGLPPGSIVYTGNQKVEEIRVHYLKYDANQLMAKESTTHEIIELMPSKPEIVDWYDMRGLHDTQLIEKFGKQFRIHPLILEDIADISQRPKYEEYEKGIFLIARALHFDSTNSTIKTEQVSLYFYNGLLLSWQETESDLFAAVRERVTLGKGRIRQRGADYLAYALLDELVDNYFHVMDEVGNVIEILEDELLSNPNNSIRERIHHLKKELLKTRKSIAPLREAVNRFAKAENEFVRETSHVFIRDLYDHTIQAQEMMENYRDILNGLQDLYLSEISFKMNQVMQVLTIITTIFVPLSFLAGLYGMNFDNIPELHHSQGYFILLTVMFLVAIGLLSWFRKRGWF
ncbi:MAG: magnesium transporter [Paraglaciecola sp.]|jgi:magnesium transporter